MSIATWIPCLRGLELALHKTHEVHSPHPCISEHCYDVQNMTPGIKRFPV